MEILILVLLIVLNGLFSMSEMALVSARKFQLEQAAKNGNKKALSALRLSEDPNKFLSTVQIGITLISILLGVFSGDRLAGPFASWLSGWAWLAPYAHNVAMVVIVLVVTFVSILVGELLPKRIGLAFPEAIAIWIASPMAILSKITAPFVALLMGANSFLLRLFGIRTGPGQKVSEEEIRAMLERGANEGEIDKIEQNIVERVFELGDRKVNSLHTYRNHIVYLDVDDDRAAIKAVIAKEKHSAYPVCKDNNIDAVVGIVRMKDIIFEIDKPGFTLKDHMQTPVFADERTSAYHLLELFKQKKIHYGVILDEYGSTQGMITLDDIIDALVGELPEAQDEDFEIVQRDEFSWLMDGQLPFIEFLRYLELDYQDSYNADFVTLAGLVISIHESIPDVGDKVEFRDLILEVLDKDGQRVDKILVTRKPPTNAPDSSPEAGLIS